MPSLLTRWCPEPHAAPITAVAHDAASGRLATADSDGRVAVRSAARPGDVRLIDRGVRVERALALSVGGELLALGGDDGLLTVHRADSGEEVHRVEADRGAALRGLAFSPDGQRLATLSVDGRLRLQHLGRGGSIGSFADLSGHALSWDDVGRRIAAIDHLQQPILLDLTTQQRLALPMIQGGARLARFTPGGRQVVVLGPRGLTLLDAEEQAVIAQRTADRSSGMLDLVLSPEGDRFAVISARSVHVFRVDGLAYVESERHGAPDPTGVALWDARGVAVAGHDGRLHRPGQPAPVSPTVCVAGRGAWRVACHEHRVAVWQERRRRRVLTPRVSLPRAGTLGVHQGAEVRELGPGERIVEACIDRDGRLLALLPERGPVHVYAADTGRLLFSAGDDTVDTPRMLVAVGVAACLLPRGGLRWFDLRNNRTFELDWVQDFDLTGGGTWLGVLTPKGRVRVLDPTTGDDALPVLPPVGDAPARLLAFVSRHPHLLVLDADGILGLYDLTPAARDGADPLLWRITAFHGCVVDQLWGLEDGRHAMARIQEDDGTATFVRIDLDSGTVVDELRGRLPYAVVDPSSGHLLEPALGSALLERAPDGSEVLVLRSLPGDEWLGYGPGGISTASGGARRLLGEEGPAVR